MGISSKTKDQSGLVRSSVAKAASNEVRQRHPKVLQLPLLQLLHVSSAYSFNLHTTQAGSTSLGRPFITGLSTTSDVP